MSICSATESPVSQRPGRCVLFHPGREAVSGKDGILNEWVNRDFIPDLPRLARNTIYRRVSSVLQSRSSQGG